MSSVRDSTRPFMNGADHGIEHRWSQPRSIASHARAIRHDATTLTGELQSTADDIERFLTDRARRRPYSTLGAAAAIGYVFGGGLRSQLTVMLFGAVARVVAARAVRELGDMAVQLNVRSPQSARHPGERNV